MLESAVEETIFLCSERDQNLEFAQRYRVPQPSTHSTLIVLSRKQDTVYNECDSQYHNFGAVSVARSWSRRSICNLAV